MLVVPVIYIYTGFQNFQRYLAEARIMKGRIIVLFAMDVGIPSRKITGILQSLS
jgi:hypothetical protein